MNCDPPSPDLGALQTQGDIYCRISRAQFPEVGIPRELFHQVREPTRAPPIGDLDGVSDRHPTVRRSQQHSSGALLREDRIGAVTGIRDDRHDPAGRQGIADEPRSRRIHTVVNHDPGREVPQRLARDERSSGCQVRIGGR